MKEAAETSVVQVLVWIMVLILFALSGCAGQVKPVHQSRSEYFKENHQREIRNDKEPKLGLALAGGGTKAADFALGVIQGLAEADIMDKVDVISTVSGGGYAALWYYVRMLDPGDASLPKREEVSQRELLKPFFEDCLPYRYQEYSGDINEGSAHLGSLPNCPTTMTNYDYPRDQFRYQNYLRGYQDLFAIGSGQIPAFSYVPTSERKWEVGLDLSLLAVGTLAAIAINAVPNVVFDWGVSLSPSLNSYEHGIARTFGAIPSAIPPICEKKDAHCKAKSDDPMYARRAEGNSKWARENLTFDLLRDKYEEGRVPLWVISATAGESRLPFSNGQRFVKTSFEFSPLGSGSGVFGYSTTRFPDKISPFKAVIASAAFLDSQQKIINPPWRDIGNAIMKISTLDWGESHPNPAISPIRAGVHRLLPFPLYYLDGMGGKNQINIHLSDGGQSENLAVYALVNRRLKDIIISDHAFDRGGTMADVCHLKHGLANDYNTPSLSVFFPGLGSLETVCDSAGEVAWGYDIFEWEHPILLGCITSNLRDEKCEREAVESGGYFAHLYLIKPVFPVNNGQSHLSQVVADAGKECRLYGGGSVECKRKVRSLCSNYSPSSPYPVGGASNTASENPWNYEKVASCELVGFMMMNAFVDEGTHDDDKCPHFPQLSTVTMTTNSSPWLYGASKELARYYSRQLGWFFGTSVINEELRDVRFHAVVDYQSKHQMRPATVNKGIFGVTEKAGESRWCLGLQSN